ncbi:MAG: SlyX family protein [Rhodanobacteraceae bacterium]
MSTSIEERLADLEIRLAFMDDAVTTLNGTVVAQDRNIARLTLELRRLRNELSELGAPASHGAAHEPPPPHY